MGTRVCAEDGGGEDEGVQDSSENALGDEAENDDKDDRGEMEGVSGSGAGGEIRHIWRSSPSSPITLLALALILPSERVDAGVE
jgi:hypothetical protein